jgi:uncharacterized protein YebE (UPF0316 family)
MKRTAELLAQNLALTAVAVVVCLMIGFVIGHVVAPLRVEAKLNLGNARINATQFEKDRMAEDVRDDVIAFSIWAGLAIGQGTFIVRGLEVRSASRAEER